MVLARLRRIEADLDSLRRGLMDAELSPADASTVVSVLGHLEKCCGVMGLRVARHCGKDSSLLVSVATGTSAHRVRHKLDTMERIEALPVVNDAVSSGQVSVDQAAVIAPALEAAPGAASSLLAAATNGSFEELKKTAGRTLRQARSEEHQVALEQRLHARRRCRVWTRDDGAVCLEARFSPVEGARLQVALDKETDAWFRAAHKAGARDPKERSCADALVALVTGAAKTAGAQVMVRVDATALHRGSLEEGEICEIEGVGPVSIEAARSLVPGGTLTALITDGVDVRTVTGTTRTIPKRIEVALAERDRCCVVPGCGSTFRLEIDHWRQQFADHGPTELDNLCRLCATHHRMKHREGWHLGGGPGKWKWVPPGRAGPAG
jgi:hypothetical protein